MEPPSTTEVGRIEYINNAKKQVVIKLALQSRKSKGVPDPESEQWKPLHERLEQLLLWLETVEMTPALRDGTKLGETLKTIYDKPDFHFQAAHVAKARELFEKFEAERWGAPEPVKRKASPDDDSKDEESGNDRRTKRQKTSTGDFYIKRPPTNHPVWGEQGIMHGIAIKKQRNGKGTSNVINDEYDGKNGKVYGHNGLRVGQWFPLRLCALFHGAHTQSQAGICGDSTNGAYSIVVSGKYDDLDTDYGDTLYYSGSGSHENDNPREPAATTTGTQMLHASIESGKPVRVLRTSEGKSRFAPTKGVRYDGLYEVVGLTRPLPKNAKGGLYEQFKLVRLPDQTSLDVCKRSPTGQNLRDMDRIKNGYPSRQD